MDQNKEILSKIREVDTGAEESGKLQVRASEIPENFDLVEGENSLLFASPKDGGEDNSQKMERQVSQQQALDIDVEVEVSTPNNKLFRFSSIYTLLFKMEEGFRF